MSVSNPSVATAATLQQQSPDIQQLISLLGSLMPLLLQFQPQPPEQSFQAGFGNFVVPDPTLDHQAAVNLVGDIITDSLRTLSGYLETHAGRHVGLQTCVPIVTQAAHSFAARDYAQAFSLIWQAYRMIATIRAADPQLPPVRAGAPAAAAPSAVSPSVH
jgi:hypothetical protein